MEKFYSAARLPRKLKENIIFDIKFTGNEKNYFDSIDDNVLLLHDGTTDRQGISYQDF